MTAIADDDAGDSVGESDSSQRGASRGLLVEATVAVGALVMNAWSLSRNGYGNSYYAAAVRSMTMSWHNFVYGSYDAGGFITTDKPPFALWVQSASAKVFGYSSWSLLLPSAVAGALSVWLLIVTVRRVWGRTAGITAGVALALTPMMFAVSRSTNPDAILVLMLVASAWATERAVTTGRLRWSALAGGLVGLGFLTKMLAAAVVLPALAGAVAFGLAAGWRRRAAHVGMIGAVFAGVALAWVGLIDLSANSPFVGGSDDGSAWNLVFGYNGFGRVFGSSGPGGGGLPGGPPGGGGGNVVEQFGGTPGIGRLFNFSIGDQVMWLSVLAAVALVAGVVTAVRRGRLDSRAGSVVLFGGWAVTTYLLFAFSEGIFHNYYVATLAPALAALVGIGVGLVLDGGRFARFVAAAALLATAVVEWVFVRRVEAYEWLRVVTPVLLIAAALALALWAPRPSWHRRRYGIVGGALVASLLAPAMWIVSGLTHAQSGSFPDSRPAVANEQFLPGGLGGAGTPTGGPNGFSVDTAVLDQLQAQTTTETWILAVDSSMQASPGIIAGYHVLAMGGFSGGDPAMSADRLAGLVRTGQLRFVAVGGPGGGPGGGRGPGVGPGVGRGGPGGRADVSSWVGTACVPFIDVAGRSSTSVYDCQGKADAIIEAGKSVTNRPSGPPPGQQP